MAKTLHGVHSARALARGRWRVRTLTADHRDTKYHITLMPRLRVALKPPLKPGPGRVELDPLSSSIYFGDPVDAKTSANDGRQTAPTYLMPMEHLRTVKVLSPTCN